MILNLYLRKLFTPILVITFALIGVYTFGYAEYFDRWFLLGLVMFFLVKVKTRDVNMAGLIAIIIFERSVEEIGFFIENHFDSKVIIYLCAAALMYKLKYDQVVKKLCIPLLMSIILAECYWYFIGYQPPRIHAYVLMLLVNIITRHLLFMRVPLTDKMVKGGKFLPLDLKLYDLSKWGIWIIAVMISEYLIRHLTPLNPLYFYQVYSMLMHSIAVLTLFYFTEDYLRSRFILDA
ncbi:hypothetical protein [Thalassomonas actiniarum]|uniref:Uncharacterized protein n=1 Tax=Thalassomonas actiniarum TaxID=485447 RepID=A0AAF0C3E1_9GAMM|nr:hypothetical protein [Thalassomonas actiniarum]WDE01107.1 hypothetical protein SG35_010995 [Thalassomonas actiniarum]